MKNKISQAAAQLGKLGGKSTSEAKRIAARENGKRGGRPSNTIKFTVAMPTEGEDIENLNAQKYANYILRELRAEFNGEYRVSVEVIDNDGTAESRVELPARVADDWQLMERAQAAMLQAESEAFCDSACYT